MGLLCQIALVCHCLGRTRSVKVIWKLPKRQVKCNLLRDTSREPAAILSVMNRGILGKKTQACYELDSS